MNTFQYIASNSRNVAIHVIAGLQKYFVQYISVSHTRACTPNFTHLSRILIVIAMTAEATENLRTAAMLLFYNLQKYSRNKGRICVQGPNTISHFRTLNWLSLMSFVQHISRVRCCHYKLQEYGKYGGRVFMQLYGKTSQSFFNNYNERIHTKTQTRTRSRFISNAHFSSSRNRRTTTVLYCDISQMYEFISTVRRTPNLHDIAIQTATLLHV